MQWVFSNLLKLVAWMLILAFLGFTISFSFLLWVVSGIIEFALIAVVGMYTAFYAVAHLVTMVTRYKTL